MTISRVTVRSLRLMRACEEQVQIFAGEWPDGVDLSLAALRRAAELHLDLEWFAFNCGLSATAWAKYKAERATAWAKCEAESATAWAKYKAERVAALWAAIESDREERVT